MKVADLMTPDVRSCTIHDSLNAAARIMWDHDCGCAPVVDAHGKLVGIVTDRDICMAAYTQGAPLEAIPVERVMSPKVISCARTDDLDGRASPDAHARDSSHPGSRFARQADRNRVVERHHKSLAWRARRRNGGRDRGNLRGDSPPPRARRGCDRCLERRRTFIARFGQSAQEEAPARVETVRRSSLDPL